MNTKKLNKFTNTKKVSVCYPYLEEIKYLIKNNASLKAIVDYLSKENVTITSSALSHFIQRYILEEEKRSNTMDILFDQAFYSAKRLVKNLQEHEKNFLQDLVKSFVEEDKIVTIENSKVLFMNFINLDKNKNSCHKFISEYIDDYFSKIECYILIKSEKDNNE